MKEALKLTWSPIASRRRQAHTLNLIKRDLYPNSRTLAADAGLLAWTMTWLCRRQTPKDHSDESPEKFDTF
jgi:hypothetical protein